MAWVGIIPIGSLELSSSLFYIGRMKTLRFFVIGLLGAATTWAATFSLNSPAFENGKPIPKIFTADGNNISPTLGWSGTPSGTKELALICEDPDAGSSPWIHWVMFSIPPSTHELPEWEPTRGQLGGTQGPRQGKNSFGNIGYGGPEPPPGKWHHYYFRLYALDARLNLPAGITAAELGSKMRGHVLAKAQWMGIYRR